MKDLVTCTHNHDDCYAYQDGQCRLLKDTNLHGRDCSFYATPEYVSECRRQSRERLISAGAEHLIRDDGGDYPWE